MGEHRTLAPGEQVAFGTRLIGSTTFYLRNVSDQIEGAVRIEPVGISEKIVKFFGFDYTEYPVSLEPQETAEVETNWAGALGRVINKGWSTIEVWTDA